QSGTLTLNVAPLSEQVVTLPYNEPELQPGDEAWITIAFSLPEANIWAPQGHEVAFDQFKLPFTAPEGSKPTTDGASLSLTESPSHIEIRGTDFVYRIDKQQGTLASLSFQGQELLNAGPKLSVYRPVISNEGT
ncbi:MAG: DUF4981 domain-containing protein, partial [Gammaproteobacteria bacterium]|nr:DUF4981 domain-containing protein [Gammaproteobacteria bacterium]